MSVEDDKTIGELAREHSMVPLWDIYHRVMTREPAAACEPAFWRYADVRPLLEKAGRDISTQEAERRVLLLRNPGLDQPFATPTLGCGLQLLLGGELEGAHRHTPSALRFVMEGDGAYTTTDGERIWMAPGDLITTPSWTWHDHGKVSEGSMVWLDGIDVPLVNHLSLNFTEYMEGDRQQVPSSGDGTSHWRYGSGFAPIEGIPDRPYSPVYAYPYDRTREVLDRLRKEEQWDACHGLKLRYVNPRTGGNIMPTIAAFMQLLPAGFQTAPYRSTDAAIYCVAEGSGRVTIGDASFAVTRHDIFVIPNWTDASFRAGTDLVLFSYSDRAMQEALCLWRERRST